MHNIVQIESDNSLARDISSHAVIAISDEKVNDYKAKKRIAQERENIIIAQQKEIEAVKSDINEIKQMLQVLMQR